MTSSQVTFVYVKNGKQRTTTCHMEDSAIDEVLHMIDQLCI